MYGEVYCEVYWHTGTLQVDRRHIAGTLQVYWHTGTSQVDCRHIAGIFCEVCCEVYWHTGTLQVECRHIAGILGLCGTNQGNESEHEAERKVFIPLHCVQLPDA